MSAQKGRCEAFGSVSDSQIMSNAETPSQAKYDAEREAIKHDIRYLLMRISMGVKEDRKRVELQRIQARLAGIVRDYCSE